jgi:hypothetical protein
MTLFSESPVTLTKLAQLFPDVHCPFSLSELSNAISKNLLEKLCDVSHVENVEKNPENRGAGR